MLCVFITLFFLWLGCSFIPENLNRIKSLDNEARFIPGIFYDPPSRESLSQGTRIRKISEAGLEITKVSEGFEPLLYDDPAGFCSIGYGHLIQKTTCNDIKHRELVSCIFSTSNEFILGINPFRGEEILRCDMTIAEVAVMKYARGDLTDNEFSALADFTFNVGAKNFKRSTLLREVNSRNYRRVPYEFRRWVLANGKVYKGLKVRREKEIALFFSGTTPRGSNEILLKESDLIDIRIGE